MNKTLSFLTLLAAMVFIAGSAQAQGQGNEKVCIEHKGEYISVSNKALDAHIAHGDTVVDDSNCSEAEEE